MFGGENDYNVHGKVVWYMSFLYGLLMLAFWVFQQYYKFTGAIQNGNIIYNHVIGIVFILYCLLWKKRHSMYPGLENHLNRRLTMVGGIGLIVVIINDWLSGSKDRWRCFTDISIVSFTVLQIIYVTWRGKIIIPKGTFIPMLGLAHLLFVNGCEFLREWTWIDDYKCASSKQFVNKTIASLIHLCMFMGMQHSSWTFYALLAKWEFLWKEDQTL